MAPGETASRFPLRLPRHLLRADGGMGQGYADIDAFAFFLGEPAPHAVRFAGADRIVGTFDADVALGTDGFGGTVAAQTCESPLVLGWKKSSGSASRHDPTSCQSQVASAGTCDRGCCGIANLSQPPALWAGVGHSHVRRADSLYVLLVPQLGIGEY